ncbi:hypothetical protein ES705_09995 [subsurface metagenome]
MGAIDKSDILGYKFKDEKGEEYYVHDSTDCLAGNDLSEVTEDDLILKDDETLDDQNLSLFCAQCGKLIR